jgi:hypothetical protein
MSEHKNILSLCVSGTADVSRVDEMPTEFLVSSGNPLPMDKPIQIVLELEPYAEIATTINDFDNSVPVSGFFSYVTRFRSVKARVKPEKTPYEDAEENALQEVIVGKRTKKPSTLNRFVGMEIDDA